MLTYVAWIQDHRFATYFKNVKFKLDVKLHYLHITVSSYSSAKFSTPMNKFVSSLVKLKKAVFKSSVHFLLPCNSEYDRLFLIQVLRQNES